MEIKRKSRYFIAALLCLLSVFQPLTQLDASRSEGDSSRIFLAKNKAEKPIPIILSADNNYAPQMYITMLSILKNSNSSTFYDFYLLVPSNFAKRYRDAILKLGGQYNCRINFMDMGVQFSNVKKSAFPPAAYYRLIAANLLPDYKKCIYLDVDLIVRHDLSELYGTKLNDYYIAGVRDMPIASTQKSYLLSIGIPDADQYVSSGVLLMNLDLMRRDDLVEELVCVVERGINDKKAFISPDQDTLNKVCYGKIKSLDLKFNVFPSICMVAAKSPEKYEKAVAFFGEKQLNEACTDPSIVHFVGSKLWQKMWTAFSDEWWEYARMSPFYEEMLHKYISYDIYRSLERKNNKFNYYRCKILSKITYGQKKIHYEKKCHSIEKRLRKSHRMRS